MEFANKEESNIGDIVEKVVEESSPAATEPTIVEVIEETVQEVKQNLLVKKEEIEENVEIACEKIEKSLGLETVSESSKPWYLSSAVIYSLVKNAVASIPYSSAIFEKTQQALCSATSYINKSTSLNVVLEVDECNSMITKLDGTLASLLVRVDDGFDALREKLGESISSLIAAISSHKAWAEKFAKEKLSEVNSSAVTTGLQSGIQSRYEQTMEIISSALALAKSHFATAKDRATTLAADTKTRAETAVKASVESAKIAAADVQAKVTSVVNETKTRAEASVQAVQEDAQARVSSLENSVRAAAAALLDAAQPYVHGAVTRSTPYVEKAVELSQPYVAAAKPYIDPVVAKATELNTSLTENKRVGPYVSQVEEAAVSLLDSAKTYCTPVAAPVAEASAVDDNAPVTEEANIRV